MCLHVPFSRRPSCFFIPYSLHYFSFLLCFWFVLCFAFVLEVCFLPFVASVLDLNLQLSLVKFTFCYYLPACVSCVWVLLVKLWQSLHYLYCLSASAAPVKNFNLLIFSCYQLANWKWQNFLAQKTLLLKRFVGSPTDNSVTLWHHTTSSCHTFASFMSRG